MEKNAIIAAALSMAVLLGWQYFVIRPMTEKREQERRARMEAKKRGGTPKKRAALPPPAPAGKAPQARAPERAGRPAPKPLVAGGQETLVRVDVGPAVYELTSRGAGLTSARLKKYFDGKGHQTELIVRRPGEALPLYFDGGSAAERLNAAVYRIEGGDLALSRSKPEGTIRFLYRAADGLAAEKEFTFRYDSYRFELKTTVEQPGDPQRIGLIIAPRISGGGNTYGGVVEGPMAIVGEKLLYDKPKADQPVRHGKDLKWAALQTKYFIAALVPRKGIEGAEVRFLRKGKQGSENAITLLLKHAGRAAASLEVFAGPKEVSRLSRLGVELERALDYGRFGFISRPLMAALRVLHAVSRNWGVAIILLTILIKLLFYPLTHVSMKSMKGMQKLQPKIAQIREIYKDDKQKLNEATMALYREHKVNPMMGCLPMVIQIPVFFGLYNALLVSIELRNAPFFWWITDLSKQDPFHVYTVLMGLSMFVQQKMTPTAGDPAQAKMMMFMPVIFTGMFIYYPVPVGLVIYWLVNNLLSIAQQYFITRSVRPPKLAEEG